MKKLLILGMAAMAVACGGSEDNDNDNNTQTKCAGQESLQQCSGNVVQTCTGGVWVDTTDCATQSKVCKPGTVAGVAACAAPQGQYTYEGFTPGSNATVVFYDDDLFGYHTLLSYDSANAPTMQLSVENYPGWPGSINPGSSGTQSLTGDNAAYATCGTCVIGVRGSGTSAKYFIGTEGSVTGTWPTTGGGPGSAALANVKMQQINPQNATVISGGETWFVSAATLSAPGSSRYPCMFWQDQDLAAGDAVCAGISAVIVCDATNEVLMVDNTCTDGIKKCNQATATTTTCVDLPCQDPLLNTEDGDFRLDSGESMCWSETEIVNCDANGNVALATDCSGSSQVCAMADTGLAAACETATP